MLLSCLLHNWLCCQGELDGGIVVKIVSPEGALLRVFWLPLGPQCFGKAGDGWCVDLLFVAWDYFLHALPGLQSFCFGFRFGRGKSFLLCLWHHLSIKAISSFNRWKLSNGQIQFSPLNIRESLGALLLSPSLPVSSSSCTVTRLTGTLFLAAILSPLDSSRHKTESLFIKQ